MKPRRSEQRIQALTLIEVLAILSAITVVAALILPALASAKRSAQRIYCVNNLDQIGLAHRIWAGDHSEKYPLQSTSTNNGALALLRQGVPDSQLARWNFLTMSNELTTPKILHCPADARDAAATAFDSNFGNTNLSYFVGLDASEDFPQMILSGDDNLAIGGVLVNSGILNLPTNATIAWTHERHIKAGNIGLADGSAQQVTINGLQVALLQTGLATNHLVIP